MKVSPRTIKVKEKYLPRYISRWNIVGVGAGLKIKGGRVTNDEAVVFYVRRKLPKSRLKPHEVIPEELDGVLTDVVEVGTVKPALSEGPPPPRTERYRPIRGGISVGHFDAPGAGTLGGIVFDVDTGDPMIISNSHVIAKCGSAREGDSILQPAPSDGGDLDDCVGYLDRWAGVIFAWNYDNMTKNICELASLALEYLGRGDYYAMPARKPINTTDAAVARVAENVDYTTEIMGLGSPVGAREPEVNMVVYKSGRTTHVTKGLITDVDATFKVDYSGFVDTPDYYGARTIFTKQVVVKHEYGCFSWGGDSGSLVLTESLEVVGLLFARAEGITLVNPISEVTSKLNVRIV